MKITLAYDEQKYPDEITKLARNFCTHRRCQMKTASFLNGAVFLEAFEDGIRKGD